MNKTVPPFTPAPATPELQMLLHEAIQNTPDGVGIFDPEDRLIYTNAALASLFAIDAADAVGMSFSELVRHAYGSGRGINIETDDIEQWLGYALGRRRSSRYRSFQTDCLDGRWVQLTEQLTDNGYMFIFFTDITEQKRIETKLQRLTGKLKVHADTDDLTGINNRRSFFRLAEKELQRCRQEKEGVSVLLLDIDHFKAINDRYGHQQGDQVLRSVSRTLGAGLRDSDVLGRIGGEEFALLLSQADPVRVEEIAERLRATIEAMRCDPPLQAVRSTVSIGYVVTQTTAVPLTTLISRADKALYQAKGMGRNRCQAWNPAWQ